MIQNIAGYKFITLDELPSLKSKLLSLCQSLALKGTILLSEEGINVFLAGAASNIRLFIDTLRADHRFSDLSFRESLSESIPFKRLRIKIKKEIITLRRPALRPEREKAPSIDPLDLKKWLDEKRDFTLLDARNAFEVAYGTFQNAVHLQLKNFCEFPDAALSIDKEKPVVLFCTGGIRCEKAALFMLESGYPAVYQLDGGILNYFEKTGGAHYNGDCFVFDEREAVTVDLTVSSPTLK